MNFIRIIAAVVALNMSFSLYSQATFIDPYRIEISSNKTTHVIFPFAIKSIDRGSLDVLAQKSPGADAVLQLKADHARIPPTNVTVITADQKLYSLLVIYDSMPQHLTISFDSTSLSTGNSISANSENTAQLKGDEQPNARDLKETAAVIEGQKKRLFSLHSFHHSLLVRLTGIYIKNDVYYFSFTIYNKSNVSFSVGTISFISKDTKRMNRKAFQEKVIEPLFQDGLERDVKGDAKGQWIIALPKFTLEDKKRLYIEILERGGGRSITFQIDNRYLLSAQKL